MNCTQVRQKLPEHRSRSLPAGDAKTLELHLKTCAACRQEWEVELFLAQALRDAPQATPPVNFAAHVLAAFEAERIPSKGNNRVWRLVPAFSYAAAALAGVALTIWTFTLTRGAAPGWFTRAAAAASARMESTADFFTELGLGLKALQTGWAGLTGQTELVLFFLITVFLLQAIPSLYFSLQATSSP